MAVDRMAAAARKKLAELEKMMAANKIYHFNGDLWKPNPAQVEILKAWDDKGKKVFSFCGANRIGKTTIGVVIAISVMAGKWLWSGEKIEFPHDMPRRVMYVGQGWETHIKTVVEPELRKLWPDCRKVEKKKNNQGVDAVWTDVETGSVLQVMSNNQESESFEGGQWDLIIWDEPPKRNNRIAGARGLVDRQGRELFVATLLTEAWINRDVIKARLPDGSPDTSVFNINADISVNVGYGLT